MREIISQEPASDCCHAFSGDPFRLCPWTSRAQPSERGPAPRPRCRGGCHSSGFVCDDAGLGDTSVPLPSHHLQEPPGKTPCSWAQHRGHRPVLTHGPVTARVEDVSISLATRKPEPNHVATQWGLVTQVPGTQPTHSTSLLLSRSIYFNVLHASVSLSAF